MEKPKGKATENEGMLGGTAFTVNAEAKATGPVVECRVPDLALGRRVGTRHGCIRGGVEGLEGAW